MYVCLSWRLLLYLVVRRHQVTSPAHIVTSYTASQYSRTCHLHHKLALGWASISAIAELVHLFTRVSRGGHRAIIHTTTDASLLSYAALSAVGRAISNLPRKHSILWSVVTRITCPKQPTHRDIPLYYTPTGTHIEMSRAELHTGIRRSEL